MEIGRRSARADYSEPRDATAAHTPACGARATLVADVSLRVTLSLSFAETKASDFSLRLTGWAKKVGGAQKGLLQSLRVKNLSKSVNIWRRYKQPSG